MSRPVRNPAGVWPTTVTPFLATEAIDWDGVDKLVEWFIEAGVAGLFAVCQSSEMYALSDDERIALATRVVNVARGRVPVVATGTFGGEIATQAAFVERIYATGVDAVIVITSQLATKEESDEVWLSRAKALVAATGEVPLGFYECPAPYKRLLTPDQLRWAAGTGRFYFHKDTSCCVSDILAKIDAVRGSRLQFFNAETSSITPAVHAGGAGFSGIGANFIPSYYVWLCDGSKHGFKGDAFDRMQAFLTVLDRVIEHHYPLSAKAYHHFNNILPFAPVSRVCKDVLDEHDMRGLQHLHALSREFAPRS